MSFTKIFLAILLGGLVFIGWRYYCSESTTSKAQAILEVVGLEPHTGITADQSITVKIRAQEMVESVDVKLDQKSIFRKDSPKKYFDIPLTLSIKDLSQGEHILLVKLTRAEIYVEPVELSVRFHVDKLPLQGTITKNQLDARIYQGRTLHIEFQTNKEIKEAALKTLSQSYPCYLQSQRGMIYECFVPIECEEVAQGYPYTIDIVDWAGNTLQLEGSFTVVAFPFKKQMLKVDKAKIEAEDKVGLPEKQLEEELVKLIAESPKKKLWQGKFIMPLDYKESSQITSDFGVIRATQERGLSQHKALDLISQPRAVVWAPQDGKIVIKARYAHSGNTIVIDHGYGLLSLYYHLDQFAPVEVGDLIKKGKPLGTVGKTGYATGYHLHWEMRVNGVAIEPLEWTQANF